MAEPTDGTSPQFALEADALSYRAGGRHPLVEGVGFSVRKGDIVAIAGPNGAGKSTLLRMLAGLLAPSAGTVRLFDRPIDRYTAADRARRIAVVGQRDEPDPRLSVADYTALGRIPHGVAAARDMHQRVIADSLASVGLTGKEDARLGLLSGGELQRAAIARALAQEPDLLFLDEPTNHLDPAAKGALLSVVAARRITTVCVLHDLALIPKIAGHTLLMSDARAVAFGPTHEVLTPDRVRKVFGVEFLHLPHPNEDRRVSVLDIPVSTDFQPTSY